MDGIISKNKFLVVAFADYAVVGGNDGLWDILACETGAGVGVARVEDKGGNFVLMVSEREC